MREILFRGKTKKGDWVNGLLGCNYLRPNEKYYYIHNCETDDTQHEVILETVGQFTGLTDKNGKKIFEGDIVKREFTLWHGETKKTRETQIGVVVYSNRECGFKIEKKCNLRKPWDGDTIEVIGNIHDNQSY